MRATHLLFIVASLAVTGLVVQGLRPPSLSPDAERVIREAVQEAVARELQARGGEGVAAEEEAVRAYLRRLVREVLAEETTGNALSPAAEALKALDLEAERRHEQLKKANADALVVDALRIASDVQAWKLKPRAFGGGAHRAGFGGLRFVHLGYTEDDANTYTNLNGGFTLRSGDSVVYVVGTNAEFKNKVVVTVRGTRPGDVSTSIETLEADS